MDIESDTHLMTSCNFCGKDRNHVKCLITGPEVAICDECTLSCVQMVDESEVKQLDKLSEESTDSFRCSFCGDYGSTDKHLCSGDGVFICNECIELAHEILVEQNLARVRKAQPLHCTFCKNASDEELIKGPGVIICHQCVARFRMVGTTSIPAQCAICAPPDPRDSLKDAQEKQHQICGECLQICEQIFLEENESQ